LITLSMSSLSTRLGGDLQAMAGRQLGQLLSWAGGKVVLVSSFADRVARTTVD
jgi:hypothetical protein